MTMARIEHVNITVSDAARSAAMLQDLFGWTIRWEGPSINNGYTVHIGSADDYIALYTPAADRVPHGRFVKGVPMNHIGVQVDDLAEAERKVAAQGFEPFSHSDYGVCQSFYFFDDNGIEFEVVSYG